MIAIRNRNCVRVEPHVTAIEDLHELLHAGDSHWDRSVSDLFFQARQLAASAVSENSDNTLIVSALLFRPCQILACGSFQAGDWTSDSLHETGTYDWLFKNFGGEIAESIRMQPFAKRFLATVVPNYFQQLSTDEQRRVLSNGGLMTSSERVNFGKLRCHSNAMKITGWLDRGAGRYLELPEMNFFIPFLDVALATAASSPVQIPGS